jgi:hypothetical protein
VKRRKERKLNIYNALIKNSLLHGLETWKLTENNKETGRSYKDGCPEEILENIKKRNN